MQNQQDSLKASGFWAGLLSRLLLRSSLRRHAPPRAGGSGAAASLAGRSRSIRGNERGVPADWADASREEPAFTLGSSQDFAVRGRLARSRAEPSCRTGPFDDLGTARAPVTATSVASTQRGRHAELVS